MKNISNFNAEKYNDNSKYTCIEEGVYLFKNMYDSIENGMYVYGNTKSSRIEPDYYVTSLSFEQESIFAEGISPKSISQYPLEDILDKYLVHISDFYNELNMQSELACYLEFASPDINDIKKLRDIIGKHVYNKAHCGADGKPSHVSLEIE